MCHVKHDWITMTTITAIATPHGAGAVSIIRLSGKDALKIGAKFFACKNFSIESINPRYMYLGTFATETFREKCFFVYFKAPRSYTGEDMVELHCHGGKRITLAVLNALISAGADMADKGEFTKRAFLNGKVSLSEAEGIVDMINAESLSALNAGYKLMNGTLTRKVRELNARIIDICAELEASLDYPDEMEEDARLHAASELSLLHIDLKTLLSTAKTGRIIKDGIDIAIIGKPNVGKSSLMNALTATESAIVTDIAGTTRDIVKERLEYKGLILNFLDTAGLRETTDKVERIGIERADACAEKSDIVIVVMDATAPQSHEDTVILERYKNKKVFKVFNKSDLGILPSNKNGFAVSAKNNTNIHELLDAIVSDYTAETTDDSGMILTELRHIQSVSNALDYIKSANYSINESSTECLLIDLKAAFHSLGEITGETANEIVIDRVFEKFCLGK